MGVLPLNRTRCLSYSCISSPNQTYAFHIYDGLTLLRPSTNPRFPMFLNLTHILCKKIISFLLWTSLGFFQNIEVFRSVAPLTPLRVLSCFHCRSLASTTINSSCIDGIRCALQSALVHVLALGVVHRNEIAQAVHSSATNYC